MQLALQYSAYAIGLWLNLLVVSALMRGTYRQYPFVLAYALTLLVSTVAEIGLRVVPKDLWDSYYWADEVILDVLVFCVVIAFIDHAARNSKQKLMERHWLVLAAAAICAISFALHYGLPRNRQMTLISRDLNICAVILDLILWSLLVAARRPDRRLMLLSGGLGLQLTGAVMGEQLRHFARSLYLTGTLLEVTTGLLALYVWWRALRPVSAPARLDHIKTL
jgi:hypothetical protein